MIYIPCLIAWNRSMFASRKKSNGVNSKVASVIMQIISNPSHTRENNMSLYASKPINFVKSEYSKGESLWMGCTTFIITMINKHIQWMLFPIPNANLHLKLEGFQYATSLNFHVKLSPNSKCLWTIILAWDKYDHQNFQMVQATVQISFKKRCQRWWLDSNSSSNMSTISWL